MRSIFYLPLSNKVGNVLTPNYAQRELLLKTWANAMVFLKLAVKAL